MRKAASKRCNTRKPRKPRAKPIPLDELRHWIDTLSATAQAQIIDNSKTIFDREPVYICLWNEQEINELKNKIKILHEWIVPH